MLTAKVFKYGNGQAVRLPKEIHTDEKEFIIQKHGDCFLLFPSSDPWYLIRRSIAKPDEDMSFERNQPRLDEMPLREEL